MVKRIVLFIVFFLPIIVLAEPLSLLQAYKKAQQYDATLKSAYADNQAQKEEVNKAFSAFLPQAKIGMYRGRGITDSETASIGGVNTNHSVYDSRNYNFSIRQSIYNKANYASYNQSKAIVSKSDALLNKEQFGLMGRVAGSYLDLLLANENIKYSEAHKSSVELQLKQAEGKFKAGLGTITEISEAKANFESVVAQYLESINALEYSKRALENITGVYVDGYFTLDANKLPMVMPEPAEVNDWIAKAYDKNPEIVAAKNDLLAASEEVEKSNSGHYPSLDFVASRSHTESDQNFTIGSKFQTDSVGFQLNIPIYSGGFVSSSVRQSLARVEEAREKISEKERAVSVDVRKYFNEIVNGLARVEAQYQSVKSYEIALIGTQKGYEAGMRSNVEVLNAQEKLYSAKRELAKERYSLIYNRLQLKQTSGILNESDISEVNGLLSYQF